MLCKIASRALVFLTLLAINAATFGQNIDWQQDLETAKQKASEEGKLVLIHFYADWCGPCQQLDSFVFNAESVARSVNETFVPVKIDIDVHPDLVSEYKIKSIPFDVAITPNGNIVHGQKSPNTSDNYLVMTERLQKLNTRMADNNTTLDSSMFAQKATSKPTSDPLKGGDSMQFNSTAIDFRPQRSAEKVASNNDFRPQGKVQTNDFVVQNKSEAPSIEGTFRPGSVANAQNFQPKQSSQTISMKPQRVVNPLAEKPSNDFVAPKNDNSFAAQPNAIQPKAVQPAQASATIRTEPKQQQVQQPSKPLRVVNDQIAQPEPPAPTKFALNGNCPVSLLTISKWVPGDERFGCTHRGKTYLFASREHMDTFLESPDQYSPVLAGFDPVAFSEKGELNDGKESLGVFMSKGGQQKIVLFESVENRNKFQQDPKRYLEAVRVATEKVDQGNTLHR